MNVTYDFQAHSNTNNMPLTVAVNSKQQELYDCIKFKIKGLVCNSFAMSVTLSFLFAEFYASAKLARRRLSCFHYVSLSRVCHGVPCRHRHF